MAFNPDEYLSSVKETKESKTPQPKVSSSFNPAEYLKAQKAPETKGSSFKDEAIAVGDLVLGIPAQVAGLATRLSIAGAESITEAVEGKDVVPGDAMRHARESVEASQDATEVNKFLSAPLKYMFKDEGDIGGNTVTENILGAVEERVTKSADWWTKETKNEAVGELLKLYVDTGVMGVSAGLVGRGASGFRDLSKKVSNYRKENQPVVAEDATPSTEVPKVTPEGEKFDPVTAKIDEWKAKAAPIDETKKVEEVLPTETLVGGVEQPAPVKPTRLASTNKEGVVTLNKEAIQADFKSGFNYVFNPDTLAGKQKAQVFANLNLTKDDFGKVVNTPEKYESFIKAHEDSHVANKDYDNYPLDANGKPDLLHPDAIKLETRATKDAWDSINKIDENVDQFDAEGQWILRTKGEDAARQYAESTLRARGETPQYTLENIQEFVSKEIKEHATTIDAASDVIERSANNIVADIRKAEIYSKSLEERIPNSVMREKITRSLEAERKGDRLNPRTDAEAIKVKTEIEKRLAQIGNRAKKAGLVDALRNNYVPHVIDWSKSKLSKGEQADLLQKIQDKIANAPKDSKIVRDFSQQRQYEFLRDLEKMLREVGGTDHGVVVHTDIARIMESYEKAMQTSIIHKSMIDFLKNGKAEDGNPWLMKDGDKAKELKYVYFEGKGSRTLRGYRVHPDLVDTMNFMFREKDPSQLLRGLGAVSHLTKALNVVGSLFHAKSLMEAGFLTDPKLFMKEVFTGGAGTKAALKAFKGDGDNKLVDLLVRDGGLMIDVEDVQRTIVADTGKFLDATAEKAFAKLGSKAQDIKVLQRVTDPLDKLVLQKLNTFTWDYMHAAQKLNVASHLFTKMKLRNPDVPDAVLAKEVSAYVNNTFGGLNWLQVANQVQNKFLKGIAKRMANIQGREWAQIVLFAPDWTVSTLRAFTTALPKELMKPQNWELRKGVKGVYNPRTQGDLARRYVITTAIAWATLINAINIMVADHPIWENDDPTRVDLGDGTSMQAAKHSMEAAHWLTNPDKTLGNKLGFFPKAMFVTTTGVAYPSPTAPKLKDTSAVSRLKAVGLLAAPFQVSSAIQAPEGEKLKRAGLSMLGLPIYGQTHSQLKKAQKEGREKSRQKRFNKLIGRE